MSWFKKKNEKTTGKRYFVKHITEGLVKYPDGEYLVLNPALMKMNKTFEGKPVFVNHVDNDNDYEKEVGRVIRSFYNEFDGAHWAEIMVYDDEGLRVINNGWVVSNSYTPTELGKSGTWHNLSYIKEITNGEYGHLALTNNPRYEESCVMTPEEFQTYNEGRKQEIEQLKNSKENFEMNEEQMKAFASILSETVTSAFKNAVEEIKEEIKEEKQNDLDEGSMVDVEEVKVTTFGDWLRGKGLVDDDISYVYEHYYRDSFADLMNETEDKDKEDKEKEPKKGAKKENSTTSKKFFNALKTAGAPSDTASRVIATSQSKLARGQDMYGSAK